MKSEEFKHRVEQVGFPTLGQRIRRARTFHRLSVRDLADRAQVSKNTITRLEKGQPVHLETLRILARALRIRPESLVAAEFDLGQTVFVHHANEGRWFDVNTYDGSVATSPEISPLPEHWSPGQIPFSPLASRDPDHRFNPNLMVITGPTPARSHRGEEFAIVLSGACRVIFDHMQVDLGVADSIYFWAAETHRYEPLEPDTRILSIVIDPFPVAPAGLRLTRRG